MRAKKFGGEVSEDKKLARLIKFGAVTDQVCKNSLLFINLLSSKINKQKKYRVEQWLIHSSK